MIKKYLQGGNTLDELNQFAQEIIQNLLFGENTEAKLQQLAKELPKVILQLFQIWKQAGIEGVVKALTQAQKAAKGAKLNRIMALGNRCPQGYLKRGGKCKKCEKGSKFTDLRNGAFHISPYFRNGGVQKKQVGGGFNWAQAAQDTTNAIGQGVASAYTYKTKKAELENLEKVNQSNNNAAIAMEGARNDYMRSAMNAQADAMFNNRRSPYTLPATSINRRFNV